MLGRVPATGDSVAWGDLSLTVEEMDGLRIERVLVTRAVKPPADGDANNF